MTIAEALANNAGLPLRQHVILTLRSGVRVGVEDCSNTLYDQLKRAAYGQGFIFQFGSSNFALTVSPAAIDLVERIKSPLALNSGAVDYVVRENK